MAAAGGANMDFTRWFHVGWYRYLFEYPCTWRKLWCRVCDHRGNLSPVVFSRGTFCTHCGDALGWSCALTLDRQTN
jgi:hypothetical protein